jgi:D-aminoacyl-tRNA deacylase
MLGRFHLHPLSARERAPLTVRDTFPVRAVVQRVREASVSIARELLVACGPGVVVLLGVAEHDTEEDASRLAGKVARLRVFEDEDGRFARSLLDVGGEALVVSQFTLIADSRRQRGTRPDFSKAASRDVAEPLYERFCEALRELGVPVQTGVFGARMQVALVNDGPVTIILET